MKIYQVQKIVIYILLLFSYQIQSVGLVTIFQDTHYDRKVGRIVPLVKNTFVNGRVNNIVITLTDHKNKSWQHSIRPGQSYSHHYEKQPLKKVVCSEKNEKNISLGESDLKTYEVFVFNTDQRVEKYHFKTIKEKEKTLQKARSLYDEKVIQDIEEQSIYNP